MTVSAILLSVLAGTTARRDVALRPIGFDGHGAELHTTAGQPPAGHSSIRRYNLYRTSLPDIEICCAAIELRNPQLARWVRKQSLAVDVCTSEELGVAIANGIHPARIVVHGDALCDTELRRAANVGVGRIIVASASQVDLLALRNEHRTQGILVRTTDPGADSYRLAAGTDDCVPFGLPFATAETDNALRAVLGHRRLNLHGLHAEIGSQDGGFFSYPTAIGHMVAEMARIRRDYGQVPTRLSLHRDVPLCDSRVGLETLAAHIDDALDDACAAMRFPRPRVLLSTGRAIPLSTT